MSGHPNRQVATRHRLARAAHMLRLRCHGDDEHYVKLAGRMLDHNNGLHLSLPGANKTFTNASKVLEKSHGKY